MKILILGHEGQIGWELANRLSSGNQVMGFSFPEIDFAKMDSVVGLMRDNSPDIVINAAAYTAVDQAESEADLAKTINSDAPGIIAEEAKKAGAVFIHYSTDFVFDGSKRIAYTEEDKPNPINEYGRSKLAGDKAVLAVDGRNFIFRVSWIYGMRGRNFLLTMKKLAMERDELSVVDDQIGCPTWCGAVAAGTVDVLSQAVSGIEQYGLYNMVCSGETSWYGFAKEILGEAATVNPVSSSEYITDAKRPAYSVLDCTKLKDAFGVELPHWRDAFKLCLTSD